MTHDDITRMAREAGAMFDHIMWVERDLFPVFARFAELVAEEVRGRTIESEKSGWIYAIDKVVEAKQEQEFIKHYGDDEGWSEWVCPDPKSYLMKCCDCGLVHEAQFVVVRYESETEREDCEPVSDPNLQAVFRLRRSAPLNAAAIRARGEK